MHLQQACCILIRVTSSKFAQAGHFALLAVTFMSVKLKEATPMTIYSVRPFVPPFMPNARSAGAVA